MRRVLALAMTVPLAAACGGDRGDMDIGGEDIGADRFSVESVEGEVKLGLTDQVVYFALTDSMAAEARSEVAEELEGKEGIGGLIGSVVGTAVDRALGLRIKYPVEEIEDIRWEDGALVIVMEDGRQLGQDVLLVDDRPATEAFDREAVESFSAEFRRVKAERGSLMP